MTRFHGRILCTNSVLNSLPPPGDPLPGDLVVTVPPGDDIGARYVSYRGARPIWMTARQAEALHTLLSAREPGDRFRMFL